MGPQTCVYLLENTETKRIQVLPLMCDPLADTATNMCMDATRVYGSEKNGY